MKPQHTKSFWARATLKTTGKVVAVVLAVALVAHVSELKSYAKDRYDDLQLFAKVLNLVQQYYIEDVDTKKLIYGGIKGMLRELDPHTNFLPPEIFKEFESETSGEFGGLGIEITVQQGVLTVISPIEDTPAYKAGIKAGDKIVTINGESTKGLTLVEAAQKMKGSNGSKVILGIFREGFEQPKDFAVVRGVVKIKSVKYTDLDDGYAYVRLTSFIENSGRDMRKEIEKHMKKYKGMKGMILDLRRNPGGLLDQAIEISNMFIDKGVIVSTMDRNKKEKQVVYAKAENTFPSFPLIVLIDEYSASASEIVSGALQDHKRAVIMGQRSFGKGSVQSVVKLGDGSGLKLTVARYYTPSGRSIQAAGIMPDVVVDNMNPDVIEKALIKTKAHRERDMKGHLDNDNEGYDDEDDVAEAPNKDKKDAKKLEHPVPAATPNFMQLWWNEDDGKKADAASTPKLKLLKDDFQLLQAYNYLRAWKIMKNFDEAKEAAPTVTK
jgi:carboxyl-terminal processing protease